MRFRIAGTWHVGFYVHFGSINLLIKSLFLLLINFNRRVVIRNINDSQNALRAIKVSLHFCFMCDCFLFEVLKANDVA